MNSETKNCQCCQQDFVIEPDDFSFYEQVKLPPPTWCPRCRAMRRMSWRNLRHMFKRTCDATGQSIFSMVPEQAKMPVYEDQYWGSDKWDAADYAQDYDFSRNFFEQFIELFNRVPWGVMWSMDMVNCAYCVSAFSKNCYFLTDSGYNEDSAYGVTLQRSTNCFDVINTKSCNQCFYSINITDCYRTMYSRNCNECSEVWFCQDCVGCTDCFGCSGLRKQKYHIFNKPHTKEEYEQKIAEMELHTWSGITKAREQAEKFWQSTPVKFMHSFQTEGSTGDYIFHASNAKNCFFIDDVRNLKYCQSIIYPPNTDGMDVTSSENTSFCCEVSGSGQLVNTCFACIENNTIVECQYCINSRGLTNCFGCVALRDKQYCIFNKQYSKEDYFATVEKIKQHMSEIPYVDANGRTYEYGEFFPPELSPYSYSQSQASEYYPLTKEQAKERGFVWHEGRERNYETTLSPRELPDEIENVRDEITEQIIQCDHDANGGHINGCNVDCARAFRVTKQELDFYRQLNLPLPRLCFNCRHVDRASWRNFPELYERQCMCDYHVYNNESQHSHHPEGRCPNTFETSYHPDKPDVIYCEECYKSEFL